MAETKIDAATLRMVLNHALEIADELEMTLVAAKVSDILDGLREA